MTFNQGKQRLLLFMGLSTNIVNIPTCPTLASSLFVGLDIDMLVSCWDGSAKNFSTFVSKAICRPTVLKFWSLGPIASMDSCAVLVGALQLAQDSGRREGFERTSGSGTILLSILCTTQTPDAQIFLMQLSGMPRPTCSLGGGRLRYRFHE